MDGLEANEITEEEAVSRANAWKNNGTLNS